MTERAILEMAMAMEEIGKGFYEALSFGSKDPAVRRLFTKLSKDEENQYAMFKELRDACSKDPARSHVPLDEDSECVRLAKEAIQPDPAVVRNVAIAGDMPAALEMVIQIEYDIIRFFRGMLASFPAAEGAITSVVTGELAHLRMLELLRPQAKAA
jgi:rubrerythrin